MLLLKWPLAALRPCMASMRGWGWDDTELQGCTHRQGWIWGILAQQKEGAGRSRGVCAVGRSPTAPFRVQLSSQDHSNTPCCGLAAVWLLQEELGLQCSSVWAMFSYICELLRFLSAEILSCMKQFLSWAFQNLLENLCGHCNVRFL